MIDNALFNGTFLNDLFAQSNREIYARITTLTQKEQAIESIEGRVSSGSINIDGSSIIRRSCSLTLVAKNLDINEFYWGVKNKFKLEIGLSNKIDSNYNDIIWFPQGIFLITDFDTNYTTKDYQIQIKGKDKMCLLNGEFGGHIPHETNFGVEEYHDLETDTRVDTDIPIKNIIREIVRNYGDELPHNIIINDIEDAGLELLEYRGNTPIYMFREINSDTFTNITFNEKQECYYLNDSYQLCKTTIGDSSHIIYDNMVNLDGVIKPTKVILSMIPMDNITEDEFINGVYYKLLKEYYTDTDGNIYIESKDRTDYYVSKADTFVYADTYEPNQQYYEVAQEYYIARFEQGSAPGYRLTDLTYAGDLIANAGDTVVTILDKIKSMLGQFEYFYNLDGKFVFQQKQNYNSSNWHNSEKDEEIIYNDSTLNMNSPIFNLLDNKLITSFKNTPKLENIKNDYSVWGKRKMDSGQEQPIHARYAIDIKPKYYKAFDGQIYYGDTELYEQIKSSIKDKAIENIKKKIESFVPQYSIPDILDAPVRLSNGDWSPGWWDIRDWADYYKLLTGTIEDPTYTMKWYSQGDQSGYQAITTFWNNSHQPSTKYVWLIVENKDGSLNSQHGGCSFDQLKTKITCTKYQFNWDKYYQGASSYQAVTKLDEKKDFYYPYAGCSDQHTYLSFLKYDIEKNGSKVYFYNPAFIDVNYEDLVDDLVKKEYEELIQNSHLVDWREVIYQMAVDYRKYYHDDDFLYNVAKNNLNYYPTGVTGYERYYTDIISFWRDLYNPNPKPISENVPYSKAFDCWVNDTLYLSNSYRKLEDKEKDEYIIDLNDLYVLDYNYEVSDDKLPETPEIVPFLGSQYCHLYYNEDKTASDDVYFYPDNEGNMNEGTDDIAELNSVNLSDIYIKERGPFITLEGYEDTYEAMESELRKILLKNYIKRAVLSDEAIKAMQNEINALDIEDFATVEEYRIAVQNIRDKYEAAATEWIYDYGKYFDAKMKIRNKYYEESSEPEVRMYYYVGGYVKPGDEWPEWNGPSEEEEENNKPTNPDYIDGRVFATGDKNNNNLFDDANNKIFMTENKQLFVVRLKKEQIATLYKKIKPYAVNDDYEAYAKHQFWVFKYPFGTKLGQYPDDYTNYAAKAFETYLNNYGWDGLYIKDSSPIKFSELDKPIQRLYYKQFGELSEYINLLQYNNFNELKTNYTESHLYIPIQSPSAYKNLEAYIVALENLTLTYVGDFPTAAKEKIEAIYNVKMKDYKTTKEYQAKINEMYLEYIDWLYLTYPTEMQKPHYKVEWVYYQNIYYNFNQDSLSGNYWCKDISNSPEQLDFWFDFINGETSFLSRYSVQAIGPRTKVVNDTTVKAISYKGVPNTIFITSQEEYEKYEHKTGYTYIRLPQEMNNIFVISSRGKSATDAVEDLIYQHCYEINNVNLQTVTIYHLQPDTCIYIKNDETNINGDYIISKITVPLDSKKMMSITATKVMPSII